MSQKNTQARNEVSSNLGKRKKDEESMDQEMESPSRKTHSSSRRPLKHSDKKRKRNQSESKSSNSRDEEMEEEKKSKGRTGEEDDEDLEDEDEYGDEDEDEEEEEEDDDGFIAREEDVEAELEEERRQRRREEREERRKRKREEREERNQRRKERERQEPELDEEDLELIQENAGVDVRKRRRLKRIVEQEDQDEQMEDQDLSRRQDLEESRQTALSQRRREELEDEEEEEQISTTDKRRQQQFAQRQVKDQSDSQIDPDRAATARQIFAEPTELVEKVNLAQKKQVKKGEHKGQLEDMFDADEIDDQFATKQDKAIAERDIPERLQIKLGERIDDLTITNHEIDWIYQRLTDDTRREDLLHYEDQAKAKIAKVLKWFRQDHSDIPLVAKFRKYEYMRELSEGDIWTIFNLDLEYGKFQQQLNQMKAFLIKISQIDPRLQQYVEDIHSVKSMQQLSNFSALITFLKSYYYEELQTLPEEQKKRLPYKSDQIQQLKRHKLDQCAKNIFLDPMLFTENFVHNAFIHKPPLTTVNISDITQPYYNDVYKELVNVLQGAIRFAAIEMGVQPYIRAQTKKHLSNIGTITTQPTEQGNKDLDPFHPSYRVKRITKEPIQNFFNEERLQDIFLDIIQNEKAGLITVSFDFPQESIGYYLQSLAEKYVPMEYPDNFKKIYNELFRSLLQEVLIPEITKEMREELKQSAENCVIKKCQEQYRNQIMTGPFSCDGYPARHSTSDDRYPGRTRKDDDSGSIIPDRPRCTVMGVILQQIDNTNQIVTVAIVDKYGELIAHKDLQHLMPPRRFNMQLNQGATDEEDQRYKKAKLQHQEEVKEHESDKDKIKDLILKHQVDLIVVGANKLEARQIKQVLSSVAEGLKDFGGIRGDYEERKGSKKRGDYGGDEEIRKEAFVIWGSLEVPKLFANSHQSQKLLKGCHPILKQAVSLARFEQDPMNEILNLWSFVPSENQALQLNLHPLQNQITQAKLSDALEEINVQCVNAVGVDLNLLVDHDHMHILLSFISGLGPRKAKNLIQDLKSKGKRIDIRKQLFIQNYITCTVFNSCSGFFKIRIPPEERTKDQLQSIDILDQIRIPQESYVFANKVAKDLIYEGKDVDLYHTQQALKQIIQNPKKLRELDLKQYSMELEKTDNQNMLVLIEGIIEEFTSPFKDPRQYRTPLTPSISNQQLFYLLIDESERTFKRGMIVTATVTRVLENVVFCKLDNGLDATIQKNDLERSEEKLQDMIQQGHVVTGRIHEIKYQDENKFGVALNCKKKDLETHDNYVDKNVVHKDDLANQAFVTDKKASHHSRFVSRRIAHPKFKNVPSARAIQELADKDIGEFLFRPSPKGENNLTLTWKFYSNNIVHIDIQEHEKPVGASIGSKLTISDEVFDNLQEIIERYIMPCNRHVREAVDHTKFRNCDSQEELELSLNQEKQADPNRIPYKLTILTQYPQHIVLGYIPKISVQKEYIKVKPRGFFFHEKYHTTPQALIDWFKNNFRTRDYQRHMKRQRSPRAKAPVMDNLAMGGQGGRPSNQQMQQQNEWGDVGNEWRRPGSVHSMNDDNTQQQQYGETPYVGSTIRASDHGSLPNEGRGRGYGRGGGNNACFNCGETGHMSRECPNKDQGQKSFGRGSRGRGQPREEGGYGRGSQRKQDYSSSNDQGMRWEAGPVTKQEEPVNWGNTAQPSNSPGYQPANESAGWGQPPTQTAQESNTLSNWGQAEPAINAGETSGGWGSKTPQRTNEFASSSGWGDNNADAQWGATGNDNFNQDERGNSPARSQRSQEEGRGRGYGRGVGFGRGRGGPGGGACFKCGQEGHMARECPNADTRPPREGRGRGGPSGGGNRNCFKCGEEGHFSRECPNPDQSRDREGGDRGRGRGRGRGGGGLCYKCNQEGHFARECPNEQQEGRPYKRQRRDDGGSVRREDEGGNDWNANVNNDNEGGSNNWGAANDNAWGSSTQQQTETQGGAQWGNSDANNSGGW